jgi:hypothetical protein
METAVGALSSFHPLAVVSRVYEAPPEEPVERGLMSTSTLRGTPPAHIRG